MTDTHALSCSTHGPEIKWGFGNSHENSLYDCTLSISAAAGRPTQPHMIESNSWRAIMRSRCFRLWKERRSWIMSATQAVLCRDSHCAVCHGDPYANVSRGVLSPLPLRSKFYIILRESIRKSFRSYWQRANSTFFIPCYLVRELHLGNSRDGKSL